MRLASLRIGSSKLGDKQRFKNLKNVSIDFDKNEWITVVIGWNGTGKSNVLEALATLFRDLIMGKDQWGNKDRPSFSFVVRYFCHGKEIEIDADPDRPGSYYLISYRECNVDDADADVSHIQSVIEYEELEVGKLQSIKFSEFKKQQDLFVPKYVFGYYSGHSSRLQDVFRPYLQQYDKKLRNPKSEDPGLRRLFYALPVHSQFVLLAFVLQQDDLVQAFLDTQLGLDTNSESESIDSVLLVLNEPSWNLNKNKNPKGEYNACKDNPDVFWGAEGVVRKFLDRVHKVSIAPIRNSRKDDSTFWNTTNREYVYLFIKDLSCLADLVGGQKPREFFRDLESTYVSELISEVRIRVKLKKNDGSVTFRELSEGEQQLLTVLGLLRFTAEDESLFLLDEPDTHLNPKWSVDYIDYLNKFSASGSTHENSSHIVLTTHNPIAIAELKQQQVQILHRDIESRAISSHQPEFDPRGMGYAGIITSDMFGLPSSVDQRTQRRLEIYRALASIKQRTVIQELRFKVIQDWLDKDRFKLNQRDDDYQRYLEARSNILAKQINDEDYQSLIKHALTLSSDERERLAQEAVDAILAEEKP